MPNKTENLDMRQAKFWIVCLARQWRIETVGELNKLNIARQIYLV